MRITNNKTLDFIYDGKKKLPWSTIAATISQAIERYPKLFSGKQAESLARQSLTDAQSVVSAAAAAVEAAAMEAAAAAAAAAVVAAVSDSNISESKETNIFFIGRI